MALKTGDEIGPYQLTEQIGAGGMATVYKAYQPKLDRHVAVKLMHDSIVADKSFLSRFEREARIVARLDHPNIVPVYDYDDYEGRPYLVMKFVEGMTLKRLMEKQVLTLQETADLLTPIADALNYAHQHGILHRDVKPSNIIIDRRGIPYLMDFGLARIAQQGESTMSIDTMLGTPHYISPEQAQGSTDLDARTDVYSLGVILYQMVSGDVPFRADSSYAIVYHHIHSTPPVPRNATPGVERVLLKALSKNPADRYSTPVALMQAFKAALNGAAAEVAPPASAKPAKTEDSEFSDLIEGLRGIGREVSEGLREAGIDISAELDEVKREFKLEVSKHNDEDDENLPDEVKIRRRVEKRIAKRHEELQGLVIHAAVYFFINIVVLQWVPIVMFLWGIGLFAHFISYVTEFVLTYGNPEAKKQSEELQGLVIHTLVYLFVNGVILGWNPWVMFFWGIGLVSHFGDYFSKFGWRQGARERMIEKEVEREYARLYGDKAKNDFQQQPAYQSPPRLRLNDEGEFTDSFVDELEQQEKRKNN